MDSAYTINGSVSSSAPFTEENKERFHNALDRFGLLSDVTLYVDRIGFSMKTASAKGRYLSAVTGIDVSFADTLRELISLDEMQGFRFNGRFTHKANNGFILPSMIFVEARNVIEKIIPERL